MANYPFLFLAQHILLQSVFDALVIAEVLSEEIRLPHDGRSH